MSVREENQQNKNCSSRGLGLTAAAIGVGVGAALYYFFSKRPENPHEQGATSNWECEQSQSFVSDEPDEQYHHSLSSNSYTTLSEHSTTDTSMYETPLRGNCHYVQVVDDDSEMNDSFSWPNQDSSRASMSIDTEDSPVIEVTVGHSFEINISMTSALNNNFTDSDSYYSSNSSVTGLEMTMPEPTSDSDNEWDVTNSSMDVPEDTRSHGSVFLNVLQNLHANLGRLSISEEEQLKILRGHAFRERSFSLEECSICFEVILKDQDVMALPCTHNFHTPCILPWLQEQQTCPNCRMAAE